jgi:DnaJ-class molecular chaperone
MQLEDAKKMAGQSLKSIYLKIASVIHPDRERDEQKRIEKTELLQQANTALEEKIYLRC